MKKANLTSPFLKLIVLIGILFWNSSTQAQSLNDSLIAYYPLDGNSLDSTSNGFDLINNGASPCPNFKGEANRAYYFNGTNSFMSLIPASQMMPLNYTLSCYMKIDGMPNNGDFSIAIEIGGTGKDHGLQIARNYNGYDGIGSFTYKLNSAANAFHVSNGFDTSAWHFYTISRGTDSLVLYIDGMRDGAVYIGDDAGYSGSNMGFYLGCRHGNQKFFGGKLDEVKLWSRALSPSEATQLYNNTLTSSRTSFSNQVISLYPNPSTGTINIKLPENSAISGALIYNNLGQKIETLSLTDGYSSIHLSKKGIYYVQFFDKSGNALTQEKLVVH